MRIQITIDLETDEVSSFFNGEAAKTPVKTKAHTDYPYVRRAKILSALRAYPNVKMSVLRSICGGMSMKTMQRDLSVLVEEGLLRKEGSRRWTRYIA